MTDINIKGRKIESQWLKIGVEGDEGVERYRFVIDRYTGNGTDLSEGIGTAVFRLSDGTEGAAKLKIEEVDETHIGLIWEIGEEATRQPGALEASIRISSLENRMWNSEIGRFTVGKTLPAPSSQPTEIMPRKAMTKALPASSMERIADPSQEKPLMVLERTISIPAELQNIAVQNDKNSEDVTILLPRYFDGFDLAQHDIYLRTLNEGGRDDILFTDAEKSVVSNEIHLTWTLKPPQTSYSGKLTIQLVVIGKDFQWSSNSAVVNIIRLIDGEPVIPVQPSLYEKWLEELSILADEAGKSKEDAAKSAAAAAGSASAAKSSETNAAKSASSAKSDADKALGYRNQAEAYKGHAASSATAAFQSKTAAETAKTAAEAAKTAAQTSAGQAKNSADAAKASEQNAGTSATAAASSKTAAETAKTAAEAAKTAAQTSAGQAKNSADAAKASEQNAAASATSAASSKTAAETAKDLAETSANQAKRFSESAQTSAQSAVQSAQDAAVSEEAAAGHVEDAQGQAARAEQEADRAEEAADRAQNIADAEFINPHTLEMEPLQMILDETFNFLFDLIKKLHNLGVTWSQIMDKGLTWREIQEKGLSWREIGVAGITPENVTALRKALMGLRR